MQASTLRAAIIRPTKTAWAVGRRHPIAGDRSWRGRPLRGRSAAAAASRTLDPKNDYYAHIRAATDLHRRYKLVVDTGNAVGGLFAPQFLRELGCEVIELFTELDDTFPNHLPDPQMPENMVDLQKKVRETSADLGIGFDGDADRVGVVDEKGERYDADYIVMLLARDVLARHPGGEVILDTKASQALVDDITKHGGKPLLWKTGHSLIKLKMREDEAPLGGEASGHIFYQDNYYLDDALFAPQADDLPPRPAVVRRVRRRPQVVRDAGDTLAALITSSSRSR
jgi:phosphomannomutase